jgi:hypothetical protein
MSAPSIEDQIVAKAAVFERDVGIWDVDLEIRPGPGADPIRQKGRTTNRMIGGGRWLIVDHSTDGGFEGHGVYGWDATTGKYTGAWVDNMQTCIAISEGTWDPASRTMTFQTEAKHQGRTICYRETVQSMDDGTRVYRNIMPAPDGGEFVMIHATYRRITGQP